MPDMSRYYDLSVSQIREGLASGQFSACELTAAALERVDAEDQKIHAFLQVTPDPVSYTHLTLPTIVPV